MYYGQYKFSSLAAAGLTHPMAPRSYPPHATPLTELRQLRAFAAASQFLHIFHEAFDQPDFDTERFETDLVASSDADRPYLRDLLIKMLRVLTLNRMINDLTWPHYLARQYIKRGMSPWHLYKPGFVGDRRPPVTSSTPGPNAGEAEPSADVQQAGTNASNSNSSNNMHTSTEGDQDLTGSTDAIERNSLLPNPPPVSGLLPLGFNAERFHTFHALTIPERVFTFYHLSQWLMEDPERLRRKMKHDQEEDCLHWRVLPLGFDSQGRTYWLFDDNRLYREHQPPVVSAAITPSSKSKASRRKPQRARRVTESAGIQRENTVGESAIDSKNWVAQDNLVNGRWEMMLCSLEDWETGSALIKKPRSADERFLLQRLHDDIMPQIVGELKAKEKRKATEDALRQRKRSSRIQIKQFRQMDEREKNHPEPDALPPRQPSPEINRPSHADMNDRTACLTPPVHESMRPPRRLPPDLLRMEASRRALPQLSPQQRPYSTAPASR
ncbi:hypothetical protein BJ085DRAFT_33754 [Dimargaris cristalligena]|uniref:WHIM1 domain-containing protein n=1 Tax=Dimargaris cristalligena TaxID=215637 RepID=A0A4P9ZNC0_9FUNG|nr:hypothetical protein BJ085DRAFT_33754 [Dimargaris cristalligena]|eukprot:RKP34904.1 hypothetical protein BJ085DRAFT_33754 [Dimargaris cristalligena]